jgi:hypothetical protein
MAAVLLPPLLLSGAGAGTTGQSGPSSTVVMLHSMLPLASQSCSRMGQHPRTVQCLA